MKITRGHTRSKSSKSAYQRSMEFRKLIVVLHLLFFVTESASVMKDFEPVLKCTCEPVITGPCAAQYDKTIFPNKVNKFGTKNDALKEFESFNRFPSGALTRECSSMLTNLLCSYYFPPCLKDLDCEGIGPCNTFCEQVRTSCEPQLLALNYTWPERLNCSKFPALESADPYCIPAAPPTPVTVESSCEEVKQPICASLHEQYTTHFPTKDFTTQHEADMQFNSFVPALNSNCSPMLKEFLCTSHYPVCATDSTTQIYPCKHVCEKVRQSCEPFLSSRNVSWPEFFNCNNFPSKSEGACIDSAPPTPSTPTTIPEVVTLPPIIEEDRCEPMLPEVSDICGGIHRSYTMTHFPYGQFTSQREAIDALKNSTEYLSYLGLINQNCAAELKPFLCLHFFPMCSPTKPITILKPCRGVCRKATNGCSACVNQWSFDCDDYTVKGDCLSLDELKQYRRKFPKETPC